MAVVHASDSDFMVKMESSGTVLAYFWAVWCPPCKRIAPVLTELGEEMPDVNIAKINVDENPETASQYGIMSIPTLLVFQNGQAVDRVVGFQSKEALKNLLARYLNE